MATAIVKSEQRQALVSLYPPVATKRSFWTALYPLPSLPSYSGSFTVGSYDIECEDTRAPLLGFTPTTLLTRVYYPTVPSPSASLASWLPSWCYAAGYGEFLKQSPYLSVAILQPLVGFVKTSAFWGVPLGGRPDQQFPVVIFSHGLGGMRTTYSHICGDLASHGFIVFAIEHRDGSASSTMVNNGQQVLKHRHMIEGEDSWAVRNGQLNQRVWEVNGLLQMVKQLSSGGNITNLIDTRLREKQRFDLLQFKGRLDMSNLVIAGHSFGAATAFGCLQQSSTQYKCGLAYDPWMWPLKMDRHITVPVITINTERFVWRENLQAIHNLHDVGHDNSLYLVLRGTAHQNQSDFPLLLNRAMRIAKMAGTMDPLRALELNNWASLAFMKKVLGLEWLQVRELDVFLQEERDQDEIIVGFDGMHVLSK